jgi:pimeloyl-ACP methyl ester carboxylesterase
MIEAKSMIRFIQGTGPTIPDHFLADRGPNSLLLVAVHGISRNAAEIAARFALDERFDGCTICAPLFERRRFGQYQQLIARNGRIPADLGLLDLIAILNRNAASRDRRTALFGFSGGAQMAHRFAMLHPEDVSAVCAVAAGWYLMPDPELAYPYGLADEVRFGTISPRFLIVPVTVAVGTQDTRIDDSVRQCDTINRLQGRTRLRRARRWVAAMRKCAGEQGVRSGTRFVSLPNGSHDFGQCVREAGLMDVAADALCDAVCSS